MEAPKSSIQLENLELPIWHGMVKLPGSGHLGGNFLCNMAETFLLTFTTSLSRFNLLVVQSSLRNLAYWGICLIASNRGRLICTFLKVSKIAWSLSVFFDLSNLLGKGKEEGTMLGETKLTKLGFVPLFSFGDANPSSPFEVAGSFSRMIGAGFFFSLLQKRFHTTVENRRLYPNISVD